MTSLLPPRLPRQADRLRAGARSASEVAADLRHRRPLLLVTALGGAVTAAATLLVCMAAGVVGWFLTDAGAHGTPSDGLRTGALGWLMGHGSGVTVQGVPVTAVPLGVTALCAWACWQVGMRVGDSISGHGPDAARLGDGERDLTVPVAVTSFTLGYAVLALIVTHAAGSAATAPSAAGVLVWSVLLAAGVGGTAIAIGSGRAATWSALLPEPLRACLSAVRLLLLTWLGVAGVVLLASLLLHFSTAVNVMSQLHTDAGAAVLYTLLTLLVLPNAAVFSGAYLLGPGFTVGVGTLVSPGAVALGPLPMFPLLAALPHGAPGWAQALQALAPLAAVYAVARTQHRRPTVRWDLGLLRGLGAGVVAGAVVGIASAIAGGAVGPGRMADVAPLAGAVLAHAVAYFGLGGLLAGAVMTWWQRRTLG